MNIKITIEKNYLMSNTQVTKIYQMQENQAEIELELGFFLTKTHLNNEINLHLIKNNKLMGVAKPFLNAPDKIFVDFFDMSIIFTFEVENA